MFKNSFGLFCVCSWMCLSVVMVAASFFLIKYVPYKASQLRLTINNRVGNMKDNITLVQLDELT